VIEAGFRSIGADGRPVIVYCHPYEFNDSELGDYDDVPRKLRFSQGIGRGSFTSKVQGLLRRFAFGRFTDVLLAWGLR